jgi:DNA-binding LacI/PurR family transcriptional regulator
MSAIRQLGYQPDALAQGLRLGRGRTVALLISDIAQGINATLTKHLQKALEEIGLDLLLYDLVHREDRLRSLLERAQGLRLRGVVIAATDVIRVAPIRQLVTKLQSLGIAIIAVNQSLGRYGIPSIVHEEAAASALAVREFLRQRRSPIAFVGRITDSATGRERYRGYRQALESAGVAVDPAFVWNCSYPYNVGYDAMAQAIERQRTPRAVVAASDELALGATAAAIDHHLRIPEDVAIIGFGGLDWRKYVRPSLTTLASDPKTVARKVRDLFEALERGDRVPLRTAVARSLVPGDSARFDRS